MNDYSILKNALGEVFEKELYSFAKEAYSLPDHVFSEKFNKKMDRLIKRRSRSYYKFINTAGKRAACIAAVIIIASLSLLTVRAVRETVYRFLVGIFGDHTEVAVESDMGDHPKTIETEYYLDGLPEGFELVEHSFRELRCFTMFVKGDEFITFEQYTTDQYHYVFDNEHSEYTEIIGENGISYFIRDDIEDDSHSVIWKNEQYIFRLESNIDKNEAIELCKSTKIKE